MAAGNQPSCWTCERTRVPSAAYEAHDLLYFLELGMGWELALTTVGWRGTREDLVALAHRVDAVKQEQQRRA